MQMIWHNYPSPRVHDACVVQTSHFLNHKTAYLNLSEQWNAILQHRGDEVDVSLLGMSTNTQRPFMFVSMHFATLFP